MSDAPSKTMAVSAHAVGQRSDVYPSVGKA
jgi:hypothetical protein